MKTAALSFIYKDQTLAQSEFMTNETLDLNEDQQLDVTIKTVKGLLLDGHAGYDKAFKKGDRKLELWWDGYIRACLHVLEAHGQ